jgi:hypothetical protein
MAKRSVKAKRAAKPRAAKKAGVKSKKPAARTAVAATAKATPYTPAPLKGDGWPPFRYPLR